MDASSLATLGRTRMSYRRVYLDNGGTKEDESNWLRPFDQERGILEAFAAALNAAVTGDTSSWEGLSVAIATTQLRYGYYNVTKRTDPEGDAEWHSEYTEGKGLPSFIYSVARGEVGGTEGLEGAVRKSDFTSVGLLSKKALQRAQDGTSLRHVSFPMGTIVRFPDLGAIHAAAVGSGWRLAGITRVSIL